MRAFSSWGLVILFVGAALAGCDPGEEEGLTDAGGGSGGTGGGGGGGGTGGRTPDARLPDAAAGSSYKWIAIFDDVKVPTEAMCRATSGPGADIDSVDLVRNGTVIGVGLRGSAVFSADQPGTTVSPCSGCGSGMTVCKHSGTQAAARAEALPDVTVVAVGDDTGYISLNAGLLWIKIGQANGNAPEQEIRPGDTVIVREVDKGYISEPTVVDTCSCLAEKYSVYAYTEMGNNAPRVQLQATRYVNATDNMAECGATPSMNLGCGTTSFTVPTP